jgi:hypothetical protein
MIVWKSALLIASLAGACIAARGDAGQPAPLSARESAALHTLIKPRADEARWATVPWMPATDLWAARRKAAAQDKPILLWYMAGEPLGTC